ncbi:hypothetical protein KQX54_005111 [Cotesia glomerata]|uniref:Uncharacterized protein n=1 Tax=Cotesia glomerata TaxID=32391 RepID=A0AAV7J1D6_COTGL|nr:hypothetical protein KQX54_005111 [Cotesia glomerata]
MEKLFQFRSEKNILSQFFFHGGHCYKRHDENDIYVKCLLKNIKKCYARGVLNRGAPITLLKGHNHSQNHNLKLIFDFKYELFKAVTSNLCDLRSIYDELSVKYPRGSFLLPFCRTVRVMQQWRRKICPPTPTSLGEYYLRLKLDRWKHLYKSNNSNLTVTNVYGRDGSIATVFIDPDFLENIQTTNLYIDATYKVCPTMPKNTYQFFTIMASINNSILPVAWSLMSRKSTDCYVAVIDHFKSLSQHIIVSSYMTDFESGLRKALKLSKLLALALLPSTDIIPTFNWLVVIHAPFYLIFKDFLNYFVDYWLMIIKPVGFCVFKLKNRTNNFTEAYHRRLNKFFGLHPSLWQFTASLRDFHDMTKIEIESLQLLTLPIRRAPRSNNLIRAEVLERAWDMYESNVLDIAHFIEFAAHWSPVLRNRNVMINIEDINNFINIPIYKYIAVPGNNYIVFNNDAANQLDYIIYEQPNE